MRMTEEQTFSGSTVADGTTASGAGPTPVVIERIKRIFTELGITDYDPQLPLQVADLAYACTKRVLREAKSVSDFAGKRHLDRSDIDFALQAFNEKHQRLCPEPAMLQKLAVDKNRLPLPAIRQNYGLRLPNDRFCQVQPNFSFVGSGGEHQMDSEISSAANMHHQILAAGEEDEDEERFELIDESSYAHEEEAYDENPSAAAGGSSSSYQQQQGGSSISVSTAAAIGQQQQQQNSSHQFDCETMSRMLRKRSAMDAFADEDYD